MIKRDVRHESALWYNSGVMAMVQRDRYIDEIQKTDALLEYAVMHGDDVEADRLRAKLRWLTNMGDRDGPSARGVAQEDCKPIWNGKN